MSMCVVIVGMDHNVGKEINFKNMPLVSAVLFTNILLNHLVQILFTSSVLLTSKFGRTNSSLLCLQPCQHFDMQWVKKAQESLFVSLRRQSFIRGFRRRRYEFETQLAKA